MPIIGIPFYLADRRLARIEQEQTGEIEDETMVTMLLRHEAGHTISYAYRLWKDPGWADVFGPFSKPYREVFHPQPQSREFVRHIYSTQSADLRPKTSRRGFCRDVRRVADAARGWRGDTATGPP